ncbi:hypothetical protein AXW82_03400 [Mycoplasmopsis canis PG 14]|nr:hypothetical protein AXW82_03400 [Mycoplasmopsis canis PG 14]
MSLSSLIVVFLESFAAFDDDVSLLGEQEIALINKVVAFKIPNEIKIVFHFFVSISYFFLFNTVLLYSVNILHHNFKIWKHYHKF